VTGWLEVASASGAELQKFICSVDNFIRHGSRLDSAAGETRWAWC